MMVTEAAAPDGKYVGFLKPDPMQDSTLEGRPNGIYPFKLFLVSLVPNYGQNRSSNGGYQLERFPRKLNWPEQNLTEARTTTKNYSNRNKTCR